MFTHLHMNIHIHTSFDKIRFAYKTYTLFIYISIWSPYCLWWKPMQGGDEIENCTGHRALDTGSLWPSHPSLECNESEPWEWPETGEGRQSRGLHRDRDSRRTFFFSFADVPLYHDGPETCPHMPLMSPLPPSDYRALALALPHSHPLSCTSVFLAPHVRSPSQILNILLSLHHTSSLNVRIHSCIVSSWVKSCTFKGWHGESWMIEPSIFEKNKYLFSSVFQNKQKKYRICN